MVEPLPDADATLVGAEEPSLADRRGRDRVAVTIGVSVRERNWRAQPAQLLDLSPSGCRVRNVPLRAGMKVWVTLDGLSAIEATASWCRQGETGIRFDAPLHAAVFQHLVTKNGGTARW